MSSDDSICILRCPCSDGSGDEWRVKHIRSLHWDLADEQHRTGNVDNILSVIREQFKDAPLFSTEEECDVYCEKLDERLQESGLPEYGDTHLTLTFPLWATQKERGVK